MYGLRARRASHRDHNIWGRPEQPTNRPPTQIAKEPEKDETGLRRPDNFGILPHFSGKWSGIAVIMSEISAILSGVFP
jgi:hypothetical protein